MASIGSWHSLLLACLLLLTSVSLHATAARAPPSTQPQHARRAAAAALVLGGDAADQCCPALGPIPVTNQSAMPRNMAFMIGAQKSGTTFLFHELVARHPRIKSHRVDICTPQRTKVSVPMKEPHYFDRIPLGSLDKYMDRYRINGDLDSTYLDATPDYMHIPSAACRIASVFPKAKLVVMIKDPVMRALSGWNMVRHQGKFDVRSFGEEIAHELQVLRELNCSYELKPPPVTGRSSPMRRVAKPPSSRHGHRKGRRSAIETEPQTAGPEAAEILNLDPSTGSNASGAGQPSGGGAADDWQRPAGLPSWNSCFRCDFSYCNGYNGPTDGHVCRQDRMGVLGNTRRGLYAYQLEHWLRFFPPEQLLVVNYEQFLRDREGTLDMIIEFLGQDPKLKRSPEFNKKRGFFTPHTNNATSVYSKVIDELYRFFAQPNAELYQLLKSLGPSIGWSGDFPASYEQHLERQAVTRRQLATLEAVEAAAGAGWRKRARSAQDALEEEAERAEAREGARRSKGRRGKNRGWGSARRGRDLLEAGPEGSDQSSDEGISDKRQRRWTDQPSLTQATELEPETPWYQTMMATWQQYGCKP